MPSFRSFILPCTAVFVVGCSDATPQAFEDEFHAAASTASVSGPSIVEIWDDFDGERFTSSHVEVLPNDDVGLTTPEEPAPIFFQSSGEDATGCVPGAQSLCEQSFAILIGVVNPQTPVNVDAIHDAAVELDEFYQSQSFGKTWFRGLENPDDVADIFAPLPLTFDGCSPTTARFALRAAAEAANPDVDFTEYRRIAYILKKSGCSGAVAGINQHYSTYFSFNATIMAHELGHNLGAYHAGRPNDDCAFTFLGPLACEYVPYGDGVDVMGAASGDFNAPHKAKAQWIPEETITTLSVDEPTLIALAPLEFSSETPQIAKIFYGAVVGFEKFYYLSYRQNTSPVQVDVHYAFRTGEPNATHPETVRVAFLHEGESWSDEVIDLAVKFHGVVDGRAVVELWRGQCQTTPASSSDDCDGNGAVDACEIFRGFAVDDDDDGVIDECEVPILFVGSGGTPPLNGTSFEHAYPALHDALNLAKRSGAIKEVWLMSGSYDANTPSALGTGATTFPLVEDVAIRGGFAGTESTPSERSRGALPSILTCASEQPCFHVVEAIDVQGSVLDRVVVEGGNANGYLQHDSVGGGLFALNADIDLVNVTLRANSADFAGGGIASLSSTLNAANLLLLNNDAGAFGAGAYILAGAAYLQNPSIVANYALGEGGAGISAIGAGVDVDNAIVFLNRDGREVGDAAAQVMSPPANFSFSTVEGFVSDDESDNSGANPYFVSAATGDFHVRCGSRTTNTGDPETEPLSDFDLDGKPRVAQNVIDRGVFEGCVPTKPISQGCELSTSPSCVH